MVKFRHVILDDYDNVIEVLHESQEYNDRWDRKWLEDEHRILMDLDSKYNFTDYNNVPNIEVQIFKNGEWRYHSNPIEDWFNL